MRLDRAANPAPPLTRLHLLQGHREGCMCVICKQARRTGKPWSGMGAGGAEAGSQALWSPRSGRHPASKAPLLRFGKQAFVRATPQLAGGPLRAHVGASRSCPALAVPVTSLCHLCACRHAKEAFAALCYHTPYLLAHAPLTHGYLHCGG